jgi:acyl-CoA hydrolase
MTGAPDEDRRLPWGLWYRPPEQTEWDLSPRPASASAVELSEQIDLTGANLLGNVHGGTVMKLVDTAGGLAAMKHCGGPVVTAALDEMTFLEPVFVGELVIVKAMVNDTGRTSLEVGVRVEAENLRTGRRVHTSSAYLVYVALDREGTPHPVPPVLLEDEEQRQRQHEAKLRRQARLQRKEAILAARRAKGE